MRNGEGKARNLRSQLWFDNPAQPWHDRALSRALPELRPDPRRAAVGQADHRHRADRLRPRRPAIAIIWSWPSGSATASATPAASPFEFPVHPIQETGKRPTAALDRNLAYLGLVEVLYGYPLDGVVLTTGCDKTTPACLMAAATVNIPAIVLSGGPMLNGWWKGKRAGSGTVVWEARARCSPRARSTTTSSWTSSPPRRRAPATATRWARPRP